jgi:two-component system, sporulation sensor kinase E
VIPLGDDNLNLTSTCEESIGLQWGERDTEPEEEVLRTVNILMVDDRSDNLLALEAVLLSTNYHLVSASSGEEALKLILEQDFAVILLDVQMPGMNGFETARMIKTRERSMHTPIVFITAINKAREHVIQGYSIGAVDYVIKPFHPETLRLKIEGLVKLNKNQKWLPTQIERGFFDAPFSLEERRSEPKHSGSQSKAEEFLISDGQTISILESITDAFYAVDRKWRFTYVNQEAERLIGISRIELIGKSLWEIYFPSSHQTVIEFKKAVAAQTPVQFEIYISDTEKWHEVRAYPSETGLSVYFSDITKRKQMETELQRSQDYFRKLFNSSPSLIALRVLKNGKYLDVNHSWLKSTGYIYEEIEGNTTDVLRIGLVSSPEREGSRPELEESISNQRIRYFTKHDEKREGLLSTEIIEIYGEKCIMSVITDITERVQLENEMARLGQLNLIGEMAAGIAHEIRNPMTTVRGFLQLSKSDYPPDHIDLMLEELDRANSIISEFLALAKNKTTDQKTQRLNTIIESIYPLLQAEAVLVNKYIGLELENCPELKLDEKEVRQIILNMVKNGFDAMDPGGTVTIKTFTDDQKVVLEISDQGIGIKEELLSKIGTPFFTTKEEGTGLGLAVCYSIASRHNAIIEVKTGEQGTSFLVCFKLN